MVEGLFEMQFACEILKKMMSDRNTAYSPLNAENSRSVSHGFMFAYAHEITIICIEHVFFFLMILT